MPWLKRFGLHLAAAVGATGIFVAAAAVGASQTRQQPSPALAQTAPPRPRPPAVPVRKPSPAPAAPAAAAAGSPSPSPAPSPSPPPTRPTQPVAPTPKVIPERSVSGTIQNVLGDGLEVMAASGRMLRVTPAPGALIRLNGKAARLEALQAGDTVVILGQAQGGPANRFLAHAITARRK